MGAMPRVDDGALRLAVLGDSTAAGIGDPVGNGAFRGFAPLLAQALGGPGRVRLVNTGTSGARTACVRREQLPIALAARPHLAVLLVGINDTLRADFDARALYTDLSAVVGALSAGGAAVLSARYHHHGRVFPLPRLVARALDRRIDELNLAIDRAVREHGARCLDLAGIPACYEPGTWSVDRLHPSALGHRALARGFADLLAAAGHAVEPVCDDDGTPARPSRAEELHWLVTQGVPWLGRRSRDLLPLALTLAVRHALGPGPAGRPARRRLRSPGPPEVTVGRSREPVNGPWPSWAEEPWPPSA